MESRLKKSLSAGGRETRANEDASRASPEDKFASTQERRKMWSEEWTQSALPKMPNLSGWHLCWLSTTNSYDSIDKRIRLGYVPVKSEELPGYEDYRVKAGEHVGHISCNEMLLFKLPMDVYQEIMTHMHDEKPREEAEKIRVQVEQLQGARDSNGKSLVAVEGEGMGNFVDRQTNHAPVFSG
ncbi:MAG: hypothetical protein WCO62_13150 [Betaproteobacteria bacterium]|jgi:hypothetical protein